MLSKKDVTLLKMQLSKYYKDYYAIISKKTHLSRPTISKFFNAKKLKPENAMKIYTICIALLEEKKEAIRAYQEKIKELTN